MQQIKDENYNKILSNILIALYKSELNREKKEEISSFYFYLNDMDIGNQDKSYVHIIGPDNDLFISSAYDLAQRLNINIFSNVDLKNKNYTDILVTNIYCDNKYFYDNINKSLSVKDTNVLINFKNIDLAPKEVQSYIKEISSELIDNILLNFESKKPLTVSLENTEQIQLFQNYTTKNKIK